MLKVNIRVPSNRISKLEEKSCSPSEQVFTLWLDDKEVGKLTKALVHLGVDANELTLDFVDRRWYSK